MHQSELPFHLYVHTMYNRIEFNGLIVVMYQSFIHVCVLHKKTLLRSLTSNSRLEYIYMYMTFNETITVKMFCNKNSFVT